MECGAPWSSLLPKHLKVSPLPIRYKQLGPTKEDSISRQFHFEWHTLPWASLFPCWFMFCSAVTSKENNSGTHLSQSHLSPVLDSFLFQVYHNWPIGMKSIQGCDWWPFLQFVLTWLFTWSLLTRGKYFNLLANSIFTSMSHTIMSTNRCILLHAELGDTKHDVFLNCPHGIYI